MASCFRSIPRTGPSPRSAPIRRALLTLAAGSACGPASVPSARPRHGGRTGGPRPVAGLPPSARRCSGHPRGQRRNASCAASRTAMTTASSWSSRNRPAPPGQRVRKTCTAGFPTGSAASPAPATTWRAICDTAVTEMHGLAGFDRTMIYRFDHDWHGEVIAEQTTGLPKRYLGHHFPASDIPAQARELYTRTLLRVIQDVDGAPVPLVPPLDPARGQPLDLSFASLRGVSPVHLQYLRNMDVQASMALSLLVGNRLLGHDRLPQRDAAPGIRGITRRLPGNGGGGRGTAVPDGSGTARLRLSPGPQPGRYACRRAVRNAGSGGGDRAAGADAAVLVRLHGASRQDSRQTHPPRHSRQLRRRRCPPGAAPIPSGWTISGSRQPTPSASI